MVLKEMAKGKEKVSSGAGEAAPEPRSLRSRKRKCDDICLTKEVQATPHQMEHGTITIQQDQAAEQYYLTKEDGTAEEQQAKEIVKVFEGQEEPAVTKVNNDTELQGFTVNSEIDINVGEEEEIMPRGFRRSPCQTSTDQHKALTSEESDGFHAAAMEEHLCEKKDFQCNLKGNHETSQEEPSSISMDVAKESVAGIPAKKKRRMGMCGLTEKERSHFLQTQKRENGQNGAAKGENQMCINTVDFVVQEETSPRLLRSSPPSTPTSSVTEQSEAEIKLQPSHCGGDDRAETEVWTAVTTSDGTSPLCCPGSSEGQSCEGLAGTMHNPELTGELESNSPVKEIVEGHLGNPQEQDPEGGTGQIHEKLNQEDTKVDCSPVITLPTDLSQNERAENENGSEAAALQLHIGTRTRSEQSEETIVDAGGGAEPDASSTGTKPGGFSCDSVDLCEAAMTPSDSERKDSTCGGTKEKEHLYEMPCDPVEPATGPCTVTTEHCQTTDTADLFGPGFLDYVSDSQLNSIALIEEEKMERKDDPGFSPSHEDATDLICGLIRELSSLNRKVMATHRELENLRRGSKTTRSSIW